MNDTHIKEDERKRIIRKVDLRILPFLWVLYLFNFLDRVNISNVGDPFQNALGLTEEQYTFGVGIFFVGYVLFEIPSNLMLRKAKPSRWIAFIIVCWGTISSAMAFIKGFPAYVVLRFILGVAEAGFFPGVIYYLTFWYRKEEQAFRQSIFFSAATVAGGVAGLIAYFVLEIESKLLEGWQLVFLIEGIPSIFLGFLTVFLLPDFPSSCSFLNENEKNILISSLPKETQDHSFSKSEMISTFSDIRVWVFSIVYLCAACVSYSVVFFLPSLVKTFGYNDVISNLLTVPVYAFATVSTLSFAYHSDLKKERPKHLFVSSLISFIGFIMIAIFPNHDLNRLAYAACCLASIGAFPSVLLTLSWLTSYVNGSTSAAIATALVICIGNIGAFFVPQVFGITYANTGNYTVAFIFISILQGIGLISIVTLYKLTQKLSSYSQIERSPALNEESDSNL